MTRNSLVVISLLACAGSAFAVPNPEIEPNETKAQATTADSGGAGMASGDTITGQTTGTSTVAGAASADIFRIKTAARALGIYRYQLATSASAGTLSGSIRGLSQSAGVIGVGDNTAQTSSGTGTPATPRIAQWYGFGKQEEIYYRLTGSATATAYTGTLSDTTVTPIIGGSVVEGNILIARAAGNTSDTDFWVYDSNFNAIATFGQDDPISPATGLTRAFTPGVYYVAISGFNLANNQPSPIDDNFRTSTVLDFPNAVINNSTTTGTNLGLTFTSSNGGAPLTVPATKAAAFDVAFIQFIVTPNVLPTSPSGTGASTAGPFCNGTANVLNYAVTVTPGQNPSSTGVAVTADLSALGGAANYALNDGGINGDATANDGIYSANFTLAANAATGTFTPTFAITDGQARSGAGSFAAVTVNAPATPPVVVENLGNFSLPAAVSRTFDLPATGIAWYSFTLTSPVSSGAGTFLDIDTVGSAGCVDTEIALFSANNCGSFITTDDDSGPGFTSQLSFGAGSRFAPAQGTCGSSGIPYAGGATLAPGTYYVAVGMFNSTFAAPYSATSTGPAAPGVKLNIRSSVLPTSPSGSGTATAASINNASAQNVNLRVTVTPGQIPDSTGLAVTVNTGGLGLGTITLLDDGVAPDAVAGDNIFNATITVPALTPAASYPLTFNIVDAQARTGTGSIAFAVTDAIGACCLSNGTSCSVISIIACNTQGGTFSGVGTSCTLDGTYAVAPSTAAFEDISATGAVLVPSTGTLDDGFQSISMGLAFNLYGIPYTSGFVSTNGFLTFTAGSTSFINSPIPSVATPNAAIYGLWDDLDARTQGTIVTQTLGTAGTDLRFIAQWNNVPRFGAAGSSNTFQVVIFETGVVQLRYGTIDAEAAAGDYTVGIENQAGTIATSVTGASLGTGNTALQLNFAPGTPTCVPTTPPCLADIAGGPTGGPDGIVDGSDFIAFINAFGAGDPQADVAGGPTGGPDGIVDGSDFIAFINAFGAGC